MRIGYRKQFPAGAATVADLERAVGAARWNRNCLS